MEIESNKGTLINSIWNIDFDENNFQLKNGEELYSKLKEDVRSNVRSNVHENVRQFLRQSRVIKCSRTFDKRLKLFGTIPQWEKII